MDKKKKKPSSRKKKSKLQNNPIIVKLNSMPLFVRIIGLVLLSALVIALTIGIISAIGSKSKIGSEAEIITVSSLKKVIDKEELRTFSAVFNAVARKYNDKDPSIIDYYVSYKSTIKLGINLEDIKISIDESDDNKTNNKIVISVPKPQILENQVDSDSLETIFRDNSYDKQGVLGEALVLCEKDVQERASENNLIFSSAEENAISMIKALVTPFVEQLDEKYDLEVKVEGKS